MQNEPESAKPHKYASEGEKKLLNKEQNG